MTEITELTVTIKNPEASYKQKFMLYEPYQLTSDDPIVKKCIDETLANSKLEPEDISVRVFLSIQ